MGIGFRLKEENTVHTIVTLPTTKATFGRTLLRLQCLIGVRLRQLLVHRRYSNNKTFRHLAQKKRTKESIVCPFVLFFFFGIDAFLLLCCIFALCVPSIMDLLPCRGRVNRVLPLVILRV